MQSASSRIGSYLGHDVCCVGVDRVAGLQDLFMEQSLVLFHSGNVELAKKKQVELVDQLVRGRPLGVFFTGADAEVLFDRLLQALDRLDDPIPLMTNFSNSGLHDVVGEFLSSTWPAEECWSYWQAYLLIGFRNTLCQLKKVARDFVEES